MVSFQAYHCRFPTLPIFGNNYLSPAFIILLKQNYSTDRLRNSQSFQIIMEAGVR